MINLTHDGAVGVVTLSHAPHNLIGDEFIDRYCTAQEDAVAAGARAILVRSDLRHFCAGADVKALGPDDGAASDPAAVLDRLESIPVPTVAAIHGAVLGGGFELADGSLITIAASPVWSPAFGRYCTMMGRNDLKSDPRFKTPELHREHYDDLMVEVAAWIRTFGSIDELEHQVSGAGGLAVGRIRTSGEALDTEWAEAIQPYYTVDVDGRELRLMRGPWRFDGLSTAPLPLAASQGAHNAEVLAELGATADEIADLADRGVLRSSE